ncbi:MAG: hypothetical protein KF797_07210 [Flavobacteriales bacterium]|nr:hypothetical protein [Flavobacteriales bacterium]
MNESTNTPKQELDRITLRAYRAVEHPEAAALFAEEHMKVLSDIGISKVTKVTSRWQQDPNVYVIAAEHDELGLVGGIRIHVSRSSLEPLPLLSAVGKLDPALPAFVERMSGGGIAEIGGLWNAHRFANRGLPMLLGTAAVSLVPQLKVECLIAVLARYTLRYATKLGLKVVEEVGEKGWFVYPKPGFWGIVMCAADPCSLDHARPDLRHRVLSLRMRPEQRTVEFTGVCHLDVQYKLELERGVISIHTYQDIRQDYLRFSA